MFASSSHSRGGTLNKELPLWKQNELWRHMAKGLELACDSLKIFLVETEKTSSYWLKPVEC